MAITDKTHCPFCKNFDFEKFKLGTESGCSVIIERHKVEAVLRTGKCDKFEDKNGE